MPKYDLIFTVKGPGGEAVVPNNTNPVEANDMADVLRQMADRLPLNVMGNTLEMRGITVKKVGE